MATEPLTALQVADRVVPIKPNSKGLFNSNHNSITPRIFELFAGNGHWFGRGLDIRPRAEAKLLHPHPVEFAESEADFTARAKLRSDQVRQTLDLPANFDTARASATSKHEFLSNLMAPPAIAARVEPQAA